MGLHLIFRSYLVCGSLVEHEMYRRLMLMHDAFVRLTNAHEDRSIGGGVDVKKVIKEFSAKETEADEWRREGKAREEMMERLRASDAEKVAEIERLKQSFHKANDMIRAMNRVYQERDHAEELLAAEKEVSESVRAHLEESQAALIELRGEHARLQESSLAAIDKCSCLESSLASVEKRVSYLESEAYEDQVILDYHLSTLGRLETALARKAGYDYLEAQLLAELRDEPSRLRRPPIIAPYLDVLSKLEWEGGGYYIGEDEGDEAAKDEEDAVDRSGSDGEETTQGAGECSTKEVSGGKVEKKASSTSSLNANAPLPTTRETGSSPPPS